MLHRVMKTMTVRDVRQRWPEAERALAEHGEIIVTRDSRPVARIVPIEPGDHGVRPALDVVALRRWRSRFWRGQPPQPSTDETLAADRADR
jgi:antitoxin (DNA-binding transcriptional repressor) of toxin-antitoxin stability system